MYRRTGTQRTGRQGRGFANAAASALRVSIAAAVAMTTVAAFAQPSRKSGRKSHPVPLSRTAPDTTATIPEDKKAVGNRTGTATSAGKNSADMISGDTIPTPVAPRNPTFKTTHFGEGLPQPFDLPTAPRSRMRTCGTKWQAIKLSGEAHSETWRDFATKCLVEGSSTKASP